MGSGKGQEPSSGQVEKIQAWPQRAGQEGKAGRAWSPGAPGLHTPTCCPSIDDAPGQATGSQSISSQASSSICLMGLPWQTETSNTGKPNSLVGQGQTRAADGRRPSS